MAEYLIITIPFVIFRFLKRSKDFWGILFLVFILLLFLFTLKLVAARTALISYPIILLLFGLTYYFIQNPNKFEWLNKKKNLFKALISVPLFFFVSILIAFYFLVTINNERKTIKDTSSGIGIVHELLLKSQAAGFLRLNNESRIGIWNQALQLGKESPLLGMGYESYGWHISVLKNLPDSNLFRSSMTDGLIYDTTHNLFLQLFISGGVTALLLWVVINGYAIMLLSYDLIYKKNLFNVPVLISILGFHLYGISQSMQYIPVIWFFIFLNLGYAMTISRDGQVSQRRKFWKLGHIISIILILSAGVVYSHNIGSKKFADKYGLKLYAENQNRDNYIGFYDPEDWNGKIFRWSLNKGILKFSGNGTIDYSLKVLHPDINKKPVIVSIYLDGKPVDRLSIWNPVSIRRQYFIPYSDKTNHELIFKVNRTWNPKKRGISKDNRELGVAVSDLYHLNETPKDGIGFYSFETWNGDNVPGWPENKELKYRWTGQRASLNLQTKFKNGRSIFLMCARPITRWFPTKVQLIGDSGVIKQLKITDTKWNQIALTPEEIGNSKVLTIQVDRTWNPKLSGISDDGRDLGVAVALLEEKS